MKTVERVLLPLAGFALCIGCTKATPKFTNLESNQLPQPLFNGTQTSLTVTAISPTGQFSVAGKCDQRIQSLEIRQPGVFDWQNLNAAAAAVDLSSVQITCATNQSFFFKVQGMTFLNNNVPPSAAMSKSFELRAVFEVGASKASSLVAQYSTVIPVKTGQFRITQGSQSAAGSLFKATARVGQVSGGSAQGSKLHLTRETH